MMMKMRMMMTCLFVFTAATCESFNQKLFTLQTKTPTKCDTATSCEICIKLPVSSSGALL